MDLIDAIRKRRSIRFFKQKEVADNELRELIDAARLAPTGGNQQKLRFIVARTPNLVKEIFDITAWAALVKPNRQPTWKETAPPVFIAVTAPNRSHEANAGAAIQNILLRSVDLNLGCCWLGAFKQKECDLILNLTDKETTLFLVAVGYPDEAPIMQGIDADGSPKYYLDDNNILHVPKYESSSLSRWC